MNNQVTLTAKLKLKNLTVDDINALTNTINNYTAALNYTAQFVADNKLYFSSYAKIQTFVYNDIRNKFKLPSQMACSVCRIVIAKYKTLKTNKQLYIKDKKTGKQIINVPCFKPKEFDLVYNRDYSFTKSNLFSINTINGRQRYDFYIKGHEHFFDGTWAFGQAKIKKVKDSFYIYVSVSKTVETHIVNTVGVDLGLNFIAVSYNGNKTTFYSGKRAKEYRAHYKKLRQELQSKNTKSSKRRLKAINERENRYINDVNHCITKALVRANPNSLFILEDLSNIRPALAKVKKADRYYMVSWSYGDFIEKLSYKALKSGSLVTEVDPSYTSQTCPICGHIAKNNRNKSKHIFTCKACGYSSNDDRIGAMNLYNKRVETV